MFDAISQAIIEILVKFVLWPVALVICTPFILVRTLFAVAYRRQKFSDVFSDGYLSVSEFWDKWVF